MGQGIYTMIGYGVSGPPPCPSEDGWRYSLGGVLENFVRHSNEATPDYLVVPLLVTDECLARGGSGTAMTRFSVPLADIARLVPPKALRAAEKTWRRVQQRAKEKFNIDLPDGELVLVCDWD